MCIFYSKIFLDKKLYKNIMEVFMTTAIMGANINGNPIYDKTFSPLVEGGLRDFVDAERRCLPPCQNEGLDAVSRFQESIESNSRLTRQLKDFINIKCEYIRSGIVSADRKLAPSNCLVDATKELNALCQNWKGAEGIEENLMKIIDGMLSYKIDNNLHLVSRFSGVSHEEMEVVKQVVLSNIDELMGKIRDFKEENNSEANALTSLFVVKKMSTLRDILNTERVDIIEKHLGDTEKRANTAILSIKTILAVMEGEESDRNMEALDVVERSLNGGRR